MNFHLKKGNGITQEELQKICHDACYAKQEEEEKRKKEEEEKRKKEEEEKRKKEEEEKRKKEEEAAAEAERNRITFKKYRKMYLDRCFYLCDDVRVEILSALIIRTATGDSVSSVVF